MKFIIHLLVLILFIIPQYIFSQSDIRFNHLTADDGLTSSNLKCVLKDHLGFLWIGTDAGLNRFDGKNVITFNHIIGDPTSLSGNNVLSLYEDELFRIWVGTQDGLSILLPESLTFINFYTIDSHGGCVDLTKGVRSIGQVKNKIWLTTSDQVVSCSQSTHSFELQIEKLLNEKNKSIRFLPCQPGYSDTGIWFLTSNGPLSINHEDTIYHKANNPKKEAIFYEDWISALINDGDSVIYFTSFSFTGVFRYRHALNVIDSIPFANDTVKGVQILSITKVKNKIWGTTMYNGTFCMDLESGKTFYFTPEENNPFSVSSYTASQLIHDADGTIFMATSMGLDYSNPVQIPFRRHTKITSRFKSPHLTGTEDNLGNLWMAPNNQGLFSYSPITENIEEYSFPGDYNRIWTMMYDNDKLILGTEAGLATFRLNDKTFHSLKDEMPTALYELIGNQSAFIKKDNSGNYWIGLVFKGLIKYNFDTKQYTLYSTTDSLLHLPNTYITTSTSDPEEILWIGYHGNDISAINTADNSIINFKLPTWTHEKVGYITSLKRDNNRNLWIATSQSGLYKYNIDLHTFEAYNTSNGLSSNMLGSIVFDQEENLWINTSNGLNKLNTTSGVFTVFTSGDGLPSSQLNFSKNFMSGDGTLYTHSSRDLASFSPGDIQPNPYFPVVVLSSYEKSGVKYQISQLPVLLHFTQRDKLIRFEFSSINFIDPDKTEYAYRLDGYDDTWHYTGNQASASFTALPQGDYTLRVKATNKSNDWNVPEKSISFHVDGPLWAKGWFIAMCFTGGLLVMYILYRYRLAQYEKLQAVRNRISKDLHDDLGSTLSSISMNSALAQRIAPASETALNPVLQDIGESARAAMDNMSDIVWAINPANETVDNMIERLEKFAQKLLAAQNIKLTLDMNPMLRNTKLTMPQRKNMYLILKESINNIAKYSKASNCYIYGRLENKKIHISIEDDGHGFPKGIITSGNGIVNMKSRATELNGTLTVDSADLKGTVINLEFAT